MKERFRQRWFNLPGSVRKPIVLTVGLAFVITAGLIGWLPGPGGIPLFLIGVAILATEYSWAERLKRFILQYVHIAGSWFRRHPRLGTAGIVLAIMAALLPVFLLLKR